MNLFVLISGEICSGKTTLASELARRYRFHSYKTNRILTKLCKKDNRIALQKFGEQLDKETNGKWVRNNFSKYLYRELQDSNFFVVDSVRILDQIKHFRASFGSSVVHVHLTASHKALFDRFKRKYNPSISPSAIKGQYTKIKKNETESQVKYLFDRADLVIDTANSTKEDVVTRVASFLGILPNIDDPLVDIIIGAQFGSEGKGHISGYLASEYNALLRVGGPNAGHTVYAEPAHEVFHLLPSGTNRAPHAKLLIGPGAVIKLDLLMEEIRRYGVETSRLVIDENATIITENDIEKECNLKSDIGSTGQGVGYATAYNIINRGKDCKTKAKDFEKELKGYIGSTHFELEKLYSAGKKVLVEGTQGTFLSIHHGIYPYVTSRDTTVSGCMAESGIAPKRVRKIIMVTRTYPIRVANPEGGTSGPFCCMEDTELGWCDISARSGILEKELIKKEKTTTTRRNRRIAEFNWSLFRKSCELNSPTDIALTFVDYISKKNRDARRFEQLTPDTIHFIEEVERCSGVSVSLISTRFDYRSVIDRRPWKKV